MGSTIRQRLFLGLIVLMLGCPSMMAVTYYDSDKMEKILIEELDIGGQPVLVVTTAKHIHYGYLGSMEGMDISSYAALVGNNGSVKIKLIGSNQTAESENSQYGAAKCAAWFNEEVVYEDITVGEKTRRIRYENINWQNEIKVTIEP